MVITHVETSTGVRANAEELGRLAREHNTLFALDGVFCVDAVITASQKALKMPLSMGVLALCGENDKQVRSFYTRHSRGR